MRSSSEKWIAFRAGRRRRERLFKGGAVHRALVRPPFVALLPQFHPSPSDTPSLPQRMRPPASPRCATPGRDRRRRMAPILVKRRLTTTRTNEVDVGVAYCNPAANSEPAQAARQTDGLIQTWHGGRRGRRSVLLAIIEIFSFPAPTRYPDGWHPSSLSLSI